MSDAPVVTEPPVSADPTPPPDATPDDLGDAGKRALEAERASAKAAEKRAKALEKRLADMEAANQTESEKAIAAAKAEGRTEALSTANIRIVKAEIKAAASGVLQDPDDAIAHIDPAGFDVDEDGNVDIKAVKAAVAALAAAKPYLTAGAKPAPLPGGGATPSTGTSMDDLIRAQVSGKGH